MESKQQDVKDVGRCDEMPWGKQSTEVFDRHIVVLDDQTFFMFATPRPFNLPYFGGVLVEGNAFPETLQRPAAPLSPI
jgi:hypothetical protein